MADREPTGDELRTYLAGERTLLAWFRTGVSLTGFGFLVERFGLFVRALEATAGQITPVHSTGFSAILGLCLVLLGVAVNVYGIVEHLRFLQNFRGTRLASWRQSLFPLVLTASLVAVGLAIAAFLLTLEWQQQGIRHVSSINVSSISGGESR